MIVKAFIVTIATDSVLNNASQAMHSDRESSGSTIYTKRKKKKKKRKNHILSISVLPKASTNFTTTEVKSHFCALIESLGSRTPLLCKR